MLNSKLHDRLQRAFQDNDDPRPSGLIAEGQAYSRTINDQWPRTPTRFLPSSLWHRSDIDGDGECDIAVRVRITAHDRDQDGKPEVVSFRADAAEVLGDGALEVRRDDCEKAAVAVASRL
jgi:hypothetical protein